MIMESSLTSHNQYVHDISVVIPVYGGEHTLTQVVSELSEFHEIHHSPDGNLYKVVEILPVFDHGRDRSDKIIRELEQRFPFVRGVWLSRNFGQHPATLAGISASNGAWVVTMDEDGQHDPHAIANMLDTALQQQADLVYANPVNAAPHSLFRNITSWGAKFVAKHLLGSTDAPKFQSFRLILGDVARALATHAGNGIYLDVALTWVANRTATCPVTLRSEGNHQSSYNLIRLLGHFWRMVLTAGTRPLRFISILGGLTAFAGIIWAIVLFFMQLFNHAISVPGWTSLMIVLLTFNGLILLSLGIIAEYISISVRADMGMPLFLILKDQEQGPLGHANTSNPNE